MKMLAMPRQPQAARAMRAGMLYIAVGALLWAMVESIGVLLADEHHPLQVVWMRYATHMLLLVAIFAPRRGVAFAHAARPRLQVVRGLLMLLMPLFFLAALSVSRPADVLGVFWAVPLLTMGLAVWLLHERVEVWRWLVALGGWAGALLIVRPGTGAIGLGALPALGMAVCLGLYLVITRTLRDESTLTNLVFTAACVLVPLSLVMPRFWAAPTGRSLALMVAIGLFGLGVLYAFDRAVELVPLAKVAPVLYLQPLWAIVLAVLLGEASVGRANLLGVVLIVSICMLLLATTGWRITRERPAGAPQHPAAGAAGQVVGLPVSPEPSSARHARTRS